MSALLGLLGAAFGLANWCILIRTWWTEKRESLIPILGFLFIFIAGVLSECGVLELLSLVLDPWPLYMLIGLLCLPFCALGRCFRNREKLGSAAGEMNWNLKSRAPTKLPDKFQFEGGAERENRRRKISLTWRIAKVTIGVLSFRGKCASR